jgi:hypothetical protein
VVLQGPPQQAENQLTRGLEGKIPLQRQQEDQQQQQQQTVQGSWCEGGSTQPALALDQTYRLSLLTIERKSSLFYQLQSAWMGAHMRQALAQSGMPGRHAQQPPSLPSLALPGLL